ncbi:hypothetical protein PYCC9005_003169 [Savitreella phatthalungensis]
MLVCGKLTPLFMASIVVQQLKDRSPLELKRPTKVYDEKLRIKIADLKLHPAIEAGLHLLNDDLYSAHFLVRKSQGQAIADYWHGILHRIENDFRNSRAWYDNADQPLLKHFFSSSEEAKRFCWACQNIVVDKNSEGHDVEAVKRQAMDEIVGVLDLAIEEFGLDARADVSDYYSSREEDKELKGQMTTGRVRREGRENE